MKNFGDKVRALRVAQDLGLRAAAAKIGISPAYLSRIERGKEPPPRADVVKTIAKVLAADPDILFRLSSSTDPEIVNYLHNRPGAMQVIRHIMSQDFSEDQLTELLKAAVAIKSSTVKE